MTTFMVMRVDLNIYKLTLRLQGATTVFRCFLSNHLGF